MQKKATTTKKTLKVTKTKYVKNVKEVELPFKTNDGHLPKKAQARKIMVKHISESSASIGTILTLPHIEATIERGILNTVSNDFKFTGVECHEETYHKMLSFIAEHRLGTKISTRFATMGEVISEAKPNQYSHLILDYCGHITKIWKDIEFALVNNIVEVDGTIAITINKRFTPSPITKRLEAINPFDGKTKTRTENLLKTLIASVGGLRYDVIETFDYSDDKGKRTAENPKGHGAWMLLMVVKRIG